MKSCGIAACVLLVALTLSAPFVHPLALAAAESQEKTSREELLISRIIEAYGGREKLAQARTIYSHGRHHTYQNDNDGPVTRYQRRPDRLRIDSALHSSSGSRVVNKQQVWMADGKDQLKAADPKTREGVMFLFNCFDLPFSLADGSWTPVSQAPETSAPANGILKLRNSAGQELTLTIDTKSHLISMVSGVITRGKELVVVAQEFKDYRQVGGIMFAHRIISHYDGKPYAMNTLYEVKINTDMADKLFTP